MNILFLQFCRTLIKQIWNSNIIFYANGHWEEYLIAENCDEKPMLKT